MEGLNYVEMQGFIGRASCKRVGRNDIPLFKCKLSVPFTFTDRATSEVKTGFEYHNLIAWADTALELGDLPDNTPIRVQGAIKTRGYDGNCKSCGNSEKKYWTDITVENFVVVDAEAQGEFNG